MAAKRRPEEVIGEWGVRDVTPPSLAERKKLIDEVEVNPLTGRPLRRRVRRFRPEPDRYLASLGGPLPYMQRLRQIDEAIEAHAARVAHAYAEHRDDPVRWRRIAERWDFGEVNDLIERHNRYYPIESRLPMDPRTRDYVKVGGRSYRREPLDAAWILDRFPAD
ncbi:MAG TPA: hypothetical protein VFU56_06005 [Gaiellaceae bacterium]|nr:hypothetical protein [Gaiellaceae bacterium]